MVALKRKRSGQEYGEDEKLLHQATKALTKEAKRVRTFLLQQAIRKSKAAALKGKGTKANSGDGDVGGSGDSARLALEKSRQDSAGSEVADEKSATRTTTETAAANAGAAAAVEAIATVAAEAGAGENMEACFDQQPTGGAGEGEGGASPSSSPASEEVLLIKVLQPSAVVKLCLRRLGLAHTGVDGEDEVKVEGGEKLQKLVSHVFEHKRVTTVMEELREKVTQRRREKLAESEGRSLPGKGRAGSGRGKGKRLAGESGTGRQGGRRKVDSGRALDAGSSGTAFVSLSGEAPSDEEWAAGPARLRHTRNKDDVASKYGPSLSPSANKTSGSGRGAGDRSVRHEPGWAGAERAAGWGRGGGRAKNGGIGSGGGRNGGGGGGRWGRQRDNPGRQEGGGVDGGRGRRGQEGGARGRGGGRGGGAREGRGDGPNGGGSFGSGTGSASGKREDSAGGQDLHGSWAAKRALKEKQASATKAFSGKRTTFGDDD